MKLKVYIEKTGSEYFAYSNEIPVKTTTGNSLEKVKSEIKELIYNGNYKNTEQEELVKNSEIEFYLVDMDELDKQEHALRNIPTGKYIIYKDIDFNELNRNEDGSVKLYKTYNDAVNASLQTNNIILQIISGGIHPAIRID